MAKTQVQKNIDTQSFLLNAADLKVSELERLAHELNALIVRKKTTQVERRERQLIQLINQTALDSNQREQYLLLAEKLEEETISEAEHQEFMTLVEVDEQLRNNRVQYLIELAQLRNITLPKLMADLGLAPISHG